MKVAEEPIARDPRVRRSRSALIRATIALVSDRGTAAVPLSDIAEAADVSRPVVYQHFGDRDTLVLQSAIDLASRELVPRMASTIGGSDQRDAALIMAEHFAAHRSFYRAVLTSSCAYELNKSLTSLLLPLNKRFLQDLSGDALAADDAEDFAAFLTGGGAAIVNTWVVEAPAPLNPEELADRLVRLVSGMTALLQQGIPTTTTTTSAKGRMP